jgi:predicted nuclease of predicted toxin-antitoxin system
MKIKLDENMPVRISAALNAMGNDVETVYSEGLSGAKDDVVWAASQGEQRLLITQDLDFSDSRRFQLSSHHGIILVRLRTPGREVLFKRIVELFKTCGLLSPGSLKCPTGGLKLNSPLPQITAVDLACWLFSLAVIRLLF